MSRRELEQYRKRLEIESSTDKDAMEQLLGETWKPASAGEQNTHNSSSWRSHRVDIYDNESVQKLRGKGGSSAND